jgi:hypothetical protein
MRVDLLLYGHRREGKYQTCDLKVLVLGDERCG